MGTKIGQVLGLHLLLGDKGESGATESDAIERFFAAVVFWAGLLSSVVAALSFAGLGQAAEPVQNFLNKITGALPSIGKAALILAAGVLAGTVLRKLCMVTLGKLDDKLPRPVGLDADEDSRPVSQTIGTVAFWFAMLVGLAGAFEALQFKAIYEPLQNILNKCLTVLPLLVVAVIIMFIGYVLSHMAKTGTASLLAAVGLDRIVNRVGLGQLLREEEGQRIYWLSRSGLHPLAGCNPRFRQAQLDRVKQPAQEHDGAVLDAAAVTVRRGYHRHSRCLVRSLTAFDSCRSSRWARDQ